MKTIASLPLLILTALLTGCAAEGPLAPAVPVADTAPPAVPVGLEATTSRSHVKVNWRPNTTDADCVGYHVYRLAYGQVWPQTTEPVTEARWLDPAPLCGPAVYAVTAVDRAGNESAWAQVRHNFVPEPPVAASAR